ncbi:MAG: substrate-binding domain-containing protein [Acidobacteria bacterium]|nr:substrate-binding domain-containing protein [Acidobacteriota bacterium]
MKGKRRVTLRGLKMVLSVIILIALGLYTLWPWLPLPGRVARQRTVVFYGFSILGEVMNQAIFPAFQQHWEEIAGERVEFISSFAGSGTVTNQLIMGVPAQLTLLSLESDAQRLSDAGVIAPQSWHRLPYHGVVNRTPFVILVRPGNPKGIRDFSDLTRTGVGVVHPDPMTSGGAKWAIVAEYGAGMRNGAGNVQAGHDLLWGIWRNVIAQAHSARAARTQFENGFGDALITYEQEALYDLGRGQGTVEIVYPRSTILSEHTLVEIERHITLEERELINAFTSFLWSEKAQSIFVEYGFRSVDERLNENNPMFGQIADPFLIDDFGGWRRAEQEIVDGVWRDRILKELKK